MTGSKPSRPAQKPKIIFKVDTPYTQSQWPHSTPDQSATCLALLTTLLAPIGVYRDAQTAHVKANRARKRKRASTDESLAESKPSPPLLQSQVLIGLASVTRHLTTLASRSQSQSTEPPDPPPCHIASIFVFANSPQTDVAFTHLPVLAKMASQVHSDLPPTRLVAMPASMEADVARTVRVPRASVVAVMHDAEGSAPLLSVVRETFAPIRVAWLDEALDGKYLPLRLEEVETLPGRKKARNLDKQHGKKDT